MNLNKDTKNKMNAPKFDFKEFAAAVIDFILDHRRIVGPIVLIVCLAIALGIGISANKNRQEAPVEEEAQESVMKDEQGVPNVPLEKDANPEVTQLLVDYYNALTVNDIETVKNLVKPASDSYLIKMEEISAYIEGFDALDVYSKPGPEEGSYVVYTVTRQKLAGYETQAVPGLSTYYVKQDEQGKYYICLDDELDEEVASYIQAVDLQEDVIDLNNKVSVEFNDLLAQDMGFAEYYSDMDAQITKSVKEKLEALYAPVEEEPDAQTEENANTVVEKVVRATDVVNMRASDSEKADKLGKAQIGDTFKVIEEKPNGWTKLSHEGKEVFIKSEYLEVVSETTVDAPAQSETAEAPADNSTAAGETKYVKAKTAVNIRKSASEKGEKLGRADQGDKFELIMKQADGWSKIKYKDQTAYIKSEYLE